MSFNDYILCSLGSLNEKKPQNLTGHHVNLINYKNTNMTWNSLKNKKWGVSKLSIFPSPEHGDTILRLESGIKTNAEKINSNFGIFEEEVKRLDEKNKQFSTGDDDIHM